MRVEADTDASVAGDEPVLLARRGGCPVVVDPDRSRAAAMLIEDGADVIIADDGLQHYRLARDYEICVIDGARGVREYGVTVAEQNAVSFELVAAEACRLNGSLARPIERFANTTVHGVAAIGNPQRFFDLLRGHGIQVIEHIYPDHAALTRKDLDFGDDFEVFMTEKDAVKLGRLSTDKFWYVPVELKMDPLLAAPLIEQIVSRLHSRKRGDG
jgi:tetraacyldisaccharide 4'-kinase